MRCSRSLLMALPVALALVIGGAPARAFLAGPGPEITGNNTGGIIPYTPAIEPIYRQLAAAYCARWGRLSHITSVHRRYGDYVGFVCIDKPWMVH
jgi:hypothetical protein